MTRIYSTFVARTLVDDSTPWLAVKSVDSFVEGASGSLKLTSLIPAPQSTCEQCLEDAYNELYLN